MKEFDEVFSRHYPIVYRYALSLCQNAAMADEIAQETFYRAFLKIDTFRGECGLSVWLCQIAKHEVYRHRRHLTRHAEQDATEGGLSLEVSLANREQAFQIHRLLHALEEPYKEVFSLRLFGELPFLDIAKLFGKTESWARVTYYRAKQKLTNAMKEEGS